MNDLTIETAAKFEHLSTMDLMFNSQISERIKDIAISMAKGKVTVPEHLRGNVGDCLAIVIQAVSWRLNPYIVAQKTHLIRGQLGYEAQLINAVTTSLGLLDGSFDYEYHGDWSKIAVPPKILKGDRGPYPVAGWNPEDEKGLSVVVTGKLRRDQKPKSLPLALVSVWPRKAGPWATDPQQQISYLAVKKWVRRYAPEAILGIYTTDEIASVEKEVQGEVIQEKAEKEAINEIMKGGESSVDFEAQQKQTPQVPKEFELPRAVHEAATKKERTEEKGEEEKEEEEKEEEEKEGWPRIGDDGKAYDSRGVPNIPEVHGKTCTSANVWRRKRGVSPEKVAKMEKPYLEMESKSIRDRQAMEANQEKAQSDSAHVEIETEIIGTTEKSSVEIQSPLFVGEEEEDDQTENSGPQPQAGPELFSHAWFNAMINTAETAQDLDEIQDMLREQDVIDKIGQGGIGIIEGKLFRRRGDFQLEQQSSAE